MVAQIYNKYSYRNNYNILEITHFKIVICYNIFIFQIMQKFLVLHLEIVIIYNIFIYQKIDIQFMNLHFIIVLVLKMLKFHKKFMLCIMIHLEIV